MFKLKNNLFKFNILIVIIFIMVRQLNINLNENNDIKQFSNYHKTGVTVDAVLDQINSFFLNSSQT